MSDDYARQAELIDRLRKAETERDALKGHVWMLRVALDIAVGIITVHGGVVPASVRQAIAATEVKPCATNIPRRYGDAAHEIS